MPPNFESLVRAARRGDQAATEALAGRACTLALRTAGAILRSREEATDIAQDVAVDVLRSLRKLRDPAAFDPWVHKITVRHTMRAIERRKQATVPLDEQPEAEPAYDDDADGLHTRELLASALAELPARQRLALALRYVHDLSDDELAQALGCRVGTVHALLSRGRAALRLDPRLADLAPTGGLTR